MPWRTEIETGRDWENGAESLLKGPDATSQAMRQGRVWAPQCSITIGADDENSIHVFINIYSGLALGESFE